MIMLSSKGCGCLGQQMVQWKFMEGPPIYMPGTFTYVII